METTMTIPKFRIVWEKTKHSHSNDQFKRFIDSLLTTNNNDDDNNNYIFLPGAVKLSDDATASITIITCQVYRTIIFIQSFQHRHYSIIIKILWP